MRKKEKIKPKHKLQSLERTGDGNKNYKRVHIWK